MRRRLLLTAALLASATAQAQQPTIYIPLISKGFQHQFWQAVKSGAEQAAKDYKVRVTFEGPESEAMVDKQIDMLAAALAKKPQAIGLAALDSKAAIPLLRKAQAVAEEPGQQARPEGRLGGGTQVCLASKQSPFHRRLRPPCAQMRCRTAPSSSSARRRSSG